jgi:hypothetical protein
MSERTIILSNQPANASSVPSGWAGKLFGLLARGFDAVTDFVSKWTNF